jgi:hypothetical protein
MRMDSASTLLDEVERFYTERDLWNQIAHGSARGAVASSVGLAFGRALAT